MEKNKVSNHNLFVCFIIILMLASTLANAGHRQRNNENSDLQKQHKLFGRHEREHWMLPEEQSEELPELWQQDKPNAKQFLKDLPPNPLFEIKEFMKPKLPTMPENKYDYDNSWDIDLDPTLPYGIQNVIPDPVRLPRAKTRITRIKFQSLCPSKRETILLNLDTEFEYRPDHYEEVTCVHPYVPYNEEDHSKAMAPVCGEAGFSCIQLNRTIFLTRRAYGVVDCWESETRLVAAGCECMWPKHFFGDISAHH